MLKRLGRGREKLFGDGRPVPLDRNAKIRVETRALALMRRVEKGRAYGPITAKAFAVLKALLKEFHNAKTGLCFPGYARIAEMAGCAVSTVGEAIKMLERAGILTWVNRLARIDVMDPIFGNRKRVIRTSNGYRFHDPKLLGRSVPPPPRPAKSSNTEKPSGTRVQDSSVVDAPSRRGSLQEDPGLEAALARWEESRLRGGLNFGIAS